MVGGAFCDCTSVQDSRKALTSQPSHPFSFRLALACKANLVCGLEPGVAERAAAVDPEWQVKGIFGVIQAVAR